MTLIPFTRQIQFEVGHREVRDAFSAVHGGAYLRVVLDENDAESCSSRMQGSASTARARSNDEYIAGGDIVRHHLMRQ